MSVTHQCLFSHRTDFVQTRIFLNLDSPALVVSQMPMESIHIMKRHHVQISFHLIHSEKMTADIEMRTPIMEFRSILDSSSRKLFCHRKALSQCLRSIENTCRRPSRNPHTILADLHSVPFGIQVFVNVYVNAVSALTSLLNLRALAGFLLDKLGEERGILHERGVLASDYGLGVDLEMAFFGHRDGFRHRDDVVFEVISHRAKA